MNCPQCRHRLVPTWTKPEETTVGDFSSLARRYKCLSCGARFATVEVPVPVFRALQAKLEEAGRPAAVFELSDLEPTADCPPWLGELVHELGA